MDSLNNLIGNIPAWVKRLDELSEQIDKRQQELAQLSENQSASADSPAGPARTKSMRNKGSTESLKPRGEPPAQPDAIPDTPLPQPQPQPASGPAPAAETPLTPSPQKDHEFAPISPSAPTPTSVPGSYNTRLALKRQTNEVMAVAQAKALATVRKRNRTESVISAEGAAPSKYRTRSMLIVYYDSYVQSFFEELVKFVSASRNMMRKAKMAARVARIKRMAELEMPDHADDKAKYDADNSLEPAKLEADVSPPAGALVAAAPIPASGGEDQDLPPLNYLSTRHMRPMTRTAGMLPSGRPVYARAAARAAYSSSSGGATALGVIDDQPPDVFDELDKGLEYVQSTCEHAAHQFLRDGDCYEEIANIQRRLKETNETANKEMERIRKEDPEALRAASHESHGPRRFRIQSMRRTSPTSPGPKEPIAALEVDDDEGIDDMDEETPKPIYRSTRAMGPPAR